MCLIPHLAQCVACRQRFQASFAHRSPASLKTALLPSRATQHEHLTYEQLTAYYDNQLPTAEQSYWATHLSICANCRAEVDYYTALRRRLAAEMTIQYGPAPGPTVAPVTWRQWPARWAAWLSDWPPATPKPAYAGVLAVLLLALTGLGGAVFWWYKAQSGPMARQTADVAPAVAQASPNSSGAPATPSPEAAVAKSQPRPATPATPPPPRANSATRTPLPPTAVATSPAPPPRLKPPPRPVTPRPPLTSRPAPAGNSVTAPVTPEMLALNLTRPTVLQELASAGGAVRSGNNDEAANPSAAPSPSGVVVREPQPLFQWQPIAGATSYRVVIADSHHQAIVQSADLPADVTHWTPPTALPAGRVLTWAVIAQVPQGEVISPAPSQPEAKFRLLTAAQRTALARQEQAPRPSLGVAVAYAQLGLLDAAERELRAYLAQHSQTPAAQSLLDKVRAW